MGTSSPDTDSTISDDAESTEVATPTAAVAPATSGGPVATDEPHIVDPPKRDGDVDVEEETIDSKWRHGSGSDFDSNQAFRETVRRHEYIARGPRERYARTVTAVQEHGWQDQLKINRQVVHGKKSCAETVYASELVKSGVYF